MRNEKGFSIFALLIVLGLIAGVVAVGMYVAGGPSPLLKSVEQKLKSIKVPTPLIGNLTPARDLRGTWTSSIRGKGLQLYGKFATGPGTTTIYEEGDITLIINKVSGNTASGTIRYTNLCSTGSTAVPGYGNITVPKQCTADTGASPINIRVSSSRLDFGTVSAGGGTFSMQGNFTTSLISGTMVATTPYGDIKGEFHLMRAH
ncbi:MAG: hypothetical protein A2172_04485 [Candidatus Woykebacteria bacterium RBG_13_40_15]|uniref:Uncharacterized protein n=1 Tax=Candidatus Woykebacteria bacterium RBG_13_40_15 TaxID=1802593 RepID=A0A1G1W738_9BACT|nr:MAG: hypothetical protein A2172_04485 [Candidatus Woykebacteria bacterium RBG_13_40_15]